MSPAGTAEDCRRSPPGTTLRSPNPTTVSRVEGCHLHLSVIIARRLGCLSQPNNWDCEKNSGLNKGLDECLSPTILTPGRAQLKFTGVAVLTLNLILQVTKGTVDEGIHAMAERKLRLDAAVLDGVTAAGDGKASGTTVETAQVLPTTSALMHARSPELCIGRCRKRKLRNSLFLCKPCRIPGEMSQALPVYPLSDAHDLTRPGELAREKVEKEALACDLCSCHSSRCSLTAWKESDLRALWFADERASAELAGQHFCMALTLQFWGAERHTMVRRVLDI